MDTKDTQVSHVDLYHKLGKLEGLMETMMASVSSFQNAIKDVHGRIDALEIRQNALEKKQSTTSGATSAIGALAKDFAIPVLAIVVTWLVAKESVSDKKQFKEIPNLYHQSYIAPGKIMTIRYF